MGRRAPSLGAVNVNIPFATLGHFYKWSDNGHHHDVRKFKGLDARFVVTVASHVTAYASVKKYFSMITLLPVTFWTQSGY